MPTATTKASTRLSNLRIVIGYCLIGFANTVLPTLVNSGAYLIVPYPRPVVILIQYLPAVAAKLLLPHLAFRISHWLRPIGLAFTWGLSFFITYVSPPNVTPVLRILAVCLSSASASAGDVSWMGLMRFYGTTGLMGWGVGTGAGLVVCSLLPYTVTVVMDQALRSGLSYVLYLVPTMLVAHYLILPSFPKTPTLDATTGSKNQGFRVQLDALEDAVPLSLLDEPTGSNQRLPPAESNVLLVRQLARPLILPLFLAFTLFAVAYPGISRAMGLAPGFTSYSAYVASYGFVFQLGNFVARSLPMGTLGARKWCSLTVSSATACLLLACAVLPLTSAMVVFPLVFVVGLGVGGKYMETFEKALVRTHDETRPEMEFSLGVIGVGEPAGLLAGGLAGCALEALLCRYGTGADRWCYTTR